MTITEAVAPTDVDAALTEHDHIVTRGEREPDLVGYALPWTVLVNTHVRPDTPIMVRLYESEQRVTVRFGGFSAEVDLFLSAGQLDRLITVLTAARRRLIEHQF